MKIFITIFVILVFNLTQAQQAESYFPDQPGFKWSFEVTPLDSLNNKIENLTYYQVDSFAVNQDFQGRNANIILSKLGPSGTINFMPYTDSQFVSISGTEFFEYVNFASVDFGDLDSIGVDLPALFNALKGWYSVYRLESPVNSKYVIFQKDTTVIINENSIPLRFELNAIRLEDETITTQSGEFNCKRFLLTRSITAIIFIFEYPLLAVQDTAWIAPENYIVKNVTPSTNVDLSELGFGSFFIPGFHQEIAPIITDINNEEYIPSEFSLNQNYPNPFNPETTIKFAIPEKGFVSLSVYNILGKKVASILNEEINEGEHSINFNASGLSSGIYFYKLNYRNKALTNKMILIK